MSGLKKLISILSAAAIACSLVTVTASAAESYDPYSDSYSGRTYMDAPEIDGTVSFTTNKNYEVGDFADVVIIGVNDYDLIGKDIND